MKVKALSKRTLVDERERLLEVCVRLAREADDEIRTESEVRHGDTKGLDEPQVALAIVRSPHRLEDS